MAALSMLAAVVGVLTSCEEHSDIYDNTLKVGNIYLSNDRVVSPEGYNPDTDDAVGVIFYVHEDTTLVVGKQEMGNYIYSDSLGTIPNVVNDAISLSGMQNTAAIRASEFAKHFPALTAPLAWSAAPCHSSVVMISLGNSTSVRPRMVLHHQQSRRTIIQSVCPLAVLSPLINGNPAEFALFFQ